MQRALAFENKLSDVFDLRILQRVFLICINRGGLYHSSDLLPCQPIMTMTSCFDSQLSGTYNR